MCFQDSVTHSPSATAATPLAGDAGGLVCDVGASWASRYCYAVQVDRVNAAPLLVPLEAAGNPKPYTSYTNMTFGRPKGLN